MVDPLNRTPEQLRGDSPISKGLDYYDEEREVFIEADRYENRWGGGEIYRDRCVNADFTVCDYHFFLPAFNDLRLVITHGIKLEFDSYDDAPRKCEAILKKVRGHEFFDSYIGKKFLERLPEILNYTLPEVYYA